MHGCQNGVWGDEADGMNDTICVRVADFNRTQFLVNLHDPTLRSIDPRIAETRLLKKKDLLLEKSGGGEKQPVGAVVMYNHRLPAVCSNFVARMPVAKGHHPRYLTYLHAALYTARINTRSIKQSTGIQNLDGASYLSEYVGTPGDREQCGIATFLDRETAKIDALVETKERLIELLQEKRTALITRAVTRGLDPNVPMKDSGVEWLGEFPAHWNTEKIKYLFERRKRQGFPRLTVLSVYREYGVIEKSSRDDNFNRTPEDLDVYQLVKPGDLVINKMKAWQGSLGVASLSGITSPDYVVYAPGHESNARFLHHLLRCKLMASVYLSNSNGIRPNQWRLEPERFEDLSLLLPPRAEQDQIAALLDREMASIDALTAKVRTAIDHLKEYRTALISAAVTGKIDVRKEAA